MAYAEMPSPNETSPDTPMITTKTNTANHLKLDERQPLLPQLTAHLGGGAYKAGKDAYEFLRAIRGGDAKTIQADVATMNLPALRRINPNTTTRAAAAVATAALLDSVRGQRLTCTEKVDAALDLLDEQLMAGW